MARTKTAGPRGRQKHLRKPARNAATHPVLAAHRDLMEAINARKSGDIKKAVRLGRQLCARYPDYVGALHELGIAQMALRNSDEALDCFVRATMLNPHDWTTLASLAQCYVQLDALEMAARTLEQARTINSDDAEIHFTLGAIYERQREYEAAADSFRAALRKNPDHAMAANLLGSCLVHLGNLTEAAQAFLRSHEIDPSNVDPVAASAMLPADMSLIDIKSAMQQATPDRLQNPDDNRAREAFVRASDLHKKREYAEAWDQLMLANRLVRKRFGKNLQARRSYREQISTIKDQAFASVHPASADDSLPVSLFILGVSRSGKTTLERMIGDAPGIKRGYENPIVELAVKRASQSAGLLSIGSMLEMPRELGREFTRFYVEELKRRAGDARVFTNTHPGRIGDVALISQLVPNARFLFVVRNREDTALRILMKQYQENTNAYAYDLAETLEEVDWYHATIQDWHDRLPAHSRIIRYEEMVANPAQAYAVVNELCGTGIAQPEDLTLPDDRGCADPYLDHFTR